MMSMLRAVLVVASAGPAPNKRGPGALEAYRGRVL